LLPVAVDIEHLSVGYVLVIKQASKNVYPDRNIVVQMLEI